MQRYPVIYQPKLVSKSTLVFYTIISVCHFHRHRHTSRQSVRVSGHDVMSEKDDMNEALLFDYDNGMCRICISFLFAFPSQLVLLPINPKIYSIHNYF